MADNTPAGADIRPEEVRLTPEEHEVIKHVLYGTERLTTFSSFDRRYLVNGAGGDGGAAANRRAVYEQLGRRSNAESMRLEDFGLDGDDIELWVPVFDILCGRATHIVAVIEDFDGGYRWELGTMERPEYKEKSWVLRRLYDSEAEHRAQYDDGMAESQLRGWEARDRCFRWVDREELLTLVERIP